jgi:hypothetical protein
VNRVRQSEQCGHSPITVNYVRSPVVPRHLSDCKGTHSNASEVKMTPRAVANGRVTCRHVQVESSDGGTPVQYFSTAMSSDRGMTDRLVPPGPTRADNLPYRPGCRESMKVAAPRKAHAPQSRPCHDWRACVLDHPHAG